MPISMAEPNKEMIISRIGGSEKIKKHLQNMGFIVGEPITVINKINDNVIVKLKGVSLAVTSDLAAKIYV